MAAHTRVAVGYNVQIAVDNTHKLIVGQQVTNQVVGLGLLTETAASAKHVLGVERIAAVALFQVRGHRDRLRSANFGMAVLHRRV